ncbi:MAG: hypothetical protein PHP50_08265 [Lachnospiraceae bacterium]|nr:hypothetical protein [Lachnospiraceae bacterium]
MEKLQPNAIVPVYLSAATIYCNHGRLDDAITMLERFATVCVEGFFPFELHGDSYFDLIDDWFADFDIGKGAPQDAKYIRKSMISLVKDNPAFEALKEMPRYKAVVKKMESLL